MHAKALLRFVCSTSKMLAVDGVANDEGCSCRSAVRCEAIDAISAAVPDDHD